MSQRPDPSEGGPVTAPDGSTVYDDEEPQVEGDRDNESDESEMLDPDDPPDSWLDSEDLYEDLTDEEAHEGRLLGEKIDTGDDEDAGG